MIRGRLVALALAMAGVLALTGHVSATTVTNGDFSAGLTGWTVAGPVSEVGGFAVIGEDPVYFNTILEQAIVVPAWAVSLSFEYSMSTTPDGTTGYPFPDALVAYLRDPVTLAPILATPGVPDYFYEERSGLQDFDPTIVAVVGNRVTLDLASVVAGTEALISFELLGGDDGYATTATIDNVRVSVVPEPLTLVCVPMAAGGLTGYLRRRRLTRA